MRRRGRVGHALREPHAARRRDVLGRARRPLARQRPAHRAPLLHRLPRLPRAARRRRARAGAAAAARAGAARGQARRRSSRATACPRRCTSAPRCCATRCSTVRERLAAVRAALALRKLDPDDPALDEQTFGDWLRAHGQSPAAIDGALEPDRAADAQPARRRRVARRGGEGLPHRPARRERRRRHRRLDRAAAAAARRRGDGRARARGRAASCSARRSRAVRRRAAGSSCSSTTAPTRPTRSSSPCRTRPSAKLVPPGVVDADALEALGASPIVNLHVHYDRRVLDEPFAAGVGTPVQWRLRPHRLVGRRRGPAGRRLALGRRRRDRRARRGAARALPAALERLLPGRARRDGARLHRDARAARDLPRRARQPPPAAGHAHVACPASTSPARGPTPAGPRRWRARSAAASPPPRAALDDLAAGRIGTTELAGGARRMTVTVTSLPAAAAHEALDRARAHLLSLQHPRRLVEGRARDERDDRRRGSLPAPLPRPRRRRRDRGDGALDPLASSATTAPGRPSTAAPATSRPRSRPTSRSGSPATRPTPRTCGAPPSSSATAAASSARACSRACGSRCSRSGRWDGGAGDPARADPAAAAARRSRSTRSAAGRGRRSWRSRSSRRCGRRRRCRSASTSC